MNLKQVFEELERQLAMSYSSEHRRGLTLAIELLRPIVKGMPEVRIGARNDLDWRTGEGRIGLVIGKDNIASVGADRCVVITFDATSDKLRAIADKLDELKEETA